MIGRYVEADYEEDYENFFSRGRNVDLTFSRSFDKENENENQIEINVNKIFLIHGLYFHCVPY